ncbi:MAG: chitin disaccharide deacetylase [Anaerorhabdus sp.]
MKLIVNADDFGLSKGVNYGILECFRNGILTSTTMMMNAPAIEHAIDLMNRYDLAVGIHLVATMFKPLTDAPSLVKSDGTFDKVKMFDAAVEINEKELEEEWRTQISLFIEKTGGKPTHIDSHHHIHMEEKAKQVVLKLADEFQLQVRGYNTPYGEKVLFDETFYKEDITVDQLKKIIAQGDIVEVMCHPAFVDNGLVNATSYAIQRKDELDTLLSDEVKTLIADKKVELITYQNINL